MRYWQVQADMRGGGQMVFGVQAQDREQAQAQVLLITDGLGVVGVQIAEILPRAERRPP